MAMRLPSLRIWSRIGIASGLMLIILIVGLRLLAFTPLAHDFVESRLETSNIRGQSIALDGLKGDLLGNLTIESLTLSDQDGIWLTASKIELGWHPIAYLYDHLHIRELAAQRIALNRYPQLSPSEASGGGPQRITLDRLDVPLIHLAAGIVGPEQKYQAIGALQTKQAQGSLQFDFTTIGDTGDTVRTDLSWGGSIPLEGTLSIDGVANGLVAQLLSVPRDQTVTLELDSSESSTGVWQLQANGAVDATPFGEVSLEMSEGESRAEGYLQLESLGILAPLSARFGKNVSFDLDLDSTNRLSAELEAESVKLSLGGIVSRSLRGADIAELSVSASNMKAEALLQLDDLNIPSVEALGTLSIRQSDIKFVGALQAPQVAYQDYRANGLNSEGEWSFSSSALETEMRLTTQSLDGLPTPLAAVLNGPVSSRFSGDFDRNTNQIRARTVLLEGGSLLLLANGFTSLDGAAALQGEVSLSALDPIRNLQTTWTLTGNDWDSLQFKLNGTARVSDQAELLRKTIGDEVDLAMTARRLPSGFALQSATLNSDQIEAEASGTLISGALDLRATTKLPSLALSQFQAKTVAAEVNLGGPVSAPRLRSTLRADSLGLAGQVFEDPVIQSNVALTQALSFSASGEASFLNEPLTFELDGSRDGDLVRINTLTSAWQSLQANGSAALDLKTPESSLISMKIDGTSPIGGAIDASFDFSNQDLSADMNVTAFQFGALDIAQTDLRLSGTWPQFVGDLTYQAEVPVLDARQPITGDHRLNADAEQRLLTITGATELAGQSIEVTSPVRLSLTDQATLSGVLSAFGGEVAMRVDPSGQASSTLALRGIQMADMGPLLHRPSLTGVLEGNFQVTLDEDGLNGQGRAEIDGLSREAADAEAATLALNILIERNILSAELKTIGDARSLDFNATLSAPLQYGGSLVSARLAPNAAIPITVQGEGEVAPLWALAAPTNLRLDGRLSIDVNNGLGETWRFQGPLTFSDGRFEDGLTGLHLKAVSADANLRPAGIDIRAARAEGRRGGSVEAAGLYEFNGAGSVAMTLNRLNAFSRSDVSVTISGNANIERQNRQTQVTGDLEIDQARINLEKLPGAGYTTLDVTFDDDDVERDTTPEREAVALNLNLSADRRIFITGSGLDTEWGLDARVTGPIGRPDIIGRASLVRGGADLLSRRFRFSEGSLRFVGAPTETEVLVRAERSSDDITSTITLSGSVLDPEITLGSEPSLPSDEILSRVLFGRSPTELSPLQAAQLAGAAAQLAGGDAFNLLGQLQEATGLDRLDIGLGEDGAATLSTGKYIADDIYLQIETGGTGAPGVALEWTPLDNVAVDAEVDPELGPKVAIQWKRDFDRLPGEPDE